MGSQDSGIKSAFGSGSFSSVRRLLQGRSLPGTVRLSRSVRGDASADSASGRIPAAPPSSGEALDSPNHAAAQAAVLRTSGELPTPASSEATGALSTAANAADGAAASGAQPAPSGGGASPTEPGPLPQQQQQSAASTSGRPASPLGGGGGNSESRSMADSRVKKFHKLLGEHVVDLDALRELAWSGVPPQLRSMCWRLLLGYLPPSTERREQILARKRREYRDMVPQFYDIPNSERSDEEIVSLRQVVVDVPRTAPEVTVFHQQPMQQSLERILYIWGIRHPASGYVQGINDLVTPFLAVFLSEHVPGSIDGWDLSTVPPERMLEVEADSYWCLCKLLDGIQDHYTYAQPGIQRTVFHLKELVRRIDEPVAQHLDDEGVDFLQFSFRWVNCLLIRELPFGLAMRLWDTYLAEGTRMKEFLIYVLAAFLLTWSQQLRTLDFQDVVMFLQRLPTSSWSEQDMESVLSRAYMWRASFNDARSHLTQL